MILQQLKTKSKGRGTWCQRGGSEGSSAAHGQGVGREEEKPHVLMAVSALNIASNRIFNCVPNVFVPDYFSPLPKLALEYT